VYLAGPEVFHPHRARIFEERRAVCARLGFEALVPLDERATTAASIYRSNLRLLAGADAVVANLSPFRGLHADPGTAWEIGHAVARDTPVFAFSDAPQALVERVAGGAGVDADGMAVEDFGLAENLMIVIGLADQRVHASFEAAVEAARRRFSAARETRS
jgi:nucleoside 2-deoxyribosyltransferase